MIFTLAHYHYDMHHIHSHDIVVFINPSEASLRLYPYMGCTYNMKILSESVISIIGKSAVSQYYFTNRVESCITITL